MKTPKAVPQASSLTPQASSLKPQDSGLKTPVSNLQSIPCELLIPSPDNPRRIPTDWRHDPGLLELAQSIRAHGVLQPLLARPMPDDSAIRPGGQRYDLLAGHRRLLAARIAGLAAVPVLVSAVTDAEALAITVTENLQRENLHPLEESKGVATLLRAMPAHEVADHLGRPLSWVLRRAKLQDLTDAWKKTMNDCRLFEAWSAAHYERIARFPHDTQNAILKYFDGHHWMVHSHLREHQQVLADFLRLLHKAPWKADDALLEPKAGACSACPKRSSVEPELFDDLEPATGKSTPEDRCLDPACWERKTAAIVRRQFQSLQEKAKDKSQPQPILLTEHPLEPKSPAGKLASSLNATVARTYEYKRARKTDKDAVPAMRADGPLTGQIVWVQPESWVRSQSSKSRPAGQDGQSAPVPLADRRAALQKRRNVLAIDRFREYLHSLAEFDRRTKTAPEVSLPELPHWTILAAALKFGIGIPVPENLDASFKWIANTSSLETDLMFRDLLRGVIRVLHDRIFIGEHDIRRVRPIAKFLLIENKLDAMIARAETEIPEPKSWASLNPDGTPRKRITPSPTSDDPTLRKRLALSGTPDPQSYPMAHESNNSCAVGRLSGPNAPSARKSKANEHGVIEPQKCEVLHLVRSSPDGEVLVYLAKDPLAGSAALGYVHGIHVRIGTARVGDGETSNYPSIRGYHHINREVALQDALSIAHKTIVASTSKSAPKILKNFLAAVAKHGFDPEKPTFVDPGNPGTLHLATPVSKLRSNQ